MMSDIIKNNEYRDWLKNLKLKFQQAQIKAAVKVNTSLLEFYWELGADIVEKQKNTTWGSGFLQQLSKDLMNEFPEIKGFSFENLKYVRRWYLFYNKDIINWEAGCFHIDNQIQLIGEQPVPQLREKLLQNAIESIIQIPWGHNLVIISKCENVDEALFYVSKTIENGWSRSVLTHQIESDLFERNGKAITNFETTLPAPQTDLAKQLIKDPYNFDFLTLSDNYNERELENALTDHLAKFLLELGAGFSFIGRQYNLVVGGDEFFIDLLFYHVKLHCYVVVELKTEKFKPEFAGQLNFYVSAIDGEVKTEEDKPTIGILICKSKNKTVVEYALSKVNNPIGVSDYQLTQSLPDKFKSTLPSIEEIEEELKKNIKL